MKGGTNVAPELSEVGSVMEREGFAVGAAAAAARGPGGGAIVLPDGSRGPAPKHEKTRKARKSAENVKKMKMDEIHSI